MKTKKLTKLTTGLSLATHTFGHFAILILNSLAPIECQNRMSVQILTKQEPSKKTRNHSLKVLNQQGRDSCDLHPWR